MAIDLGQEIEARLRIARDEVARLEQMLAIFKGTSAIDPGPVVPDLELNGLPLYRAIEEYLRAEYDRGKEEITVGELEKGLKPYKLVTRAKGKPVWDNPHPWKLICHALRSPGNLDKRWRLSRSGDHVERSDRISLVKAPRYRQHRPFTS